MAYERLYVFTMNGCKFCAKAKEILSGDFKKKNPTVMVIYLAGNNNRFGWTPSVLPGYLLANGNTAIGQFEGLLDTKHLQAFYDNAVGSKDMGKIR